MKTIYISGKITGLDLEAVDNKFTIAKLSNMALGYNVVNPRELDHTGNTKWIHYMITDIKHLLRCDSIYMLKDWKRSKGAIIEFVFAFLFGLEIIYQKNTKY